MKVLVTGGAASGKSAYAEQLVMEWEGPHYYLATMSSLGCEAQLRIDRHLALRDGKGFITLDMEQLGVEGVFDVLKKQRGTVLLEDLGNLVTSFLYTRQGFLLDEDQVFERTMTFVDALAERCDNVVVVCSRVGADGSFAAASDSYVALIGRVSCAIAAQYDHVIEVVFEQPVAVKGACL